MKTESKKQSESKTLLAQKNHSTMAKVNGLALSNVLLLALAVCLCMLATVANSEPSPNQVQASGDGGQSGEQFAPKRQYFIAPRIGRSPGGPSGLAGTRNSQTIWSSLEGASLMAPGQVQPSLGYPRPLRQSLLLLLGNRRLVGTRSSGLLPQARIGRRASPSGLLPQPRVGRRSADGLVFEPQLGGDSSQQSESNEMSTGSLDGGEPGQQEVAMAAMSDNAALNEAVESLISGRR